MMRIGSAASLTLAALTAPASAWAVDSYRYLHVTIETPWWIFIGLFFLVVAPMALAAILYWRYAGEDRDAESDEAGGGPGAKGGDGGDGD